MPSVGKVELAVGAVAGGIVGLLGGWSEAMTCLVVLIIVDFMLGTARAALQHKLSSWESVRKTGIKLLLIWCLVVVGRQLDVWFGTGMTVRDAVIAFLATAQATSVLENAVPVAAAVGWTVPPILTEMLAQLGSKGRKSNGS